MTDKFTWEPGDIELEDDTSDDFSYGLDELERYLEDKIKVDKETATYTDDSTTAQHCSACTMFIPPRHCDTVEGVINPDGWCKFYNQRDDVELAKDVFKELDHPRGQPENKGQFVEGGGNSSGVKEKKENKPQKKL